MATVVQIPPPVGSSGQFIDVVNISSSTLREIVVIGSPVTSGALAPVTSTGGLRVSLSTEDGNIIRIAGGTTQVAPVSLIDGLLVEVSNPDFFALTSGVVTLSSVHTFVLSSVSVFPSDINVLITSTNGVIAPVTSSGGLLVTLVGSASGSTAVNIIGTSSAIAPVTSSGGLGVTILGGAASGSTSVNLVGSSNGIGPVTTSGGLLVTIVAGAGAGSTAVNIIGTSSAIGPVTSSGGQLVALSNPAALALTSGTVTLSSAIAISSGIITLSSPISISSGLITLSSVHTVTATAATNPWSSAPSFNVPIVSVSSGLVQISGTVATVSASSGVIQIQPQTTNAGLVFGYVSSSSANSNLITGSPAAYYGYEVFNTTGQFRFVHFYHTSSAPGIGTTANWIHSVMVPYSTAGGGGAIAIKDSPKSYSTKGLGFTITDGPSSTSTGSVGNNDVLLTVHYKT